MNENTYTVKLPEILASQLKTLARKRGVSRSEVVGQALTEYISRGDAPESVSFLELARDLVGSIEGPSDLSTKKSYLK